MPSSHSSASDADAVELSWEDIETWLCTYVRGRCEKLVLECEAQCATSDETEARVTAVVCDAREMFTSHVSRREQRSTTSSTASVRAKQDAAKAAVMCGLKEMMCDRGLMVKVSAPSPHKSPNKKKAGNTSPSPKKKASQIGMSDYEVERQRNISANLGMLRTLGLA